MATTENYIDGFEVAGVTVPVRDSTAFREVSGGTAGQFLTKTETGAEWTTPKSSVSYYKTFTASQWTVGEAEATMTIPQSEHGLSGADVFAQAAILSDGSYLKGTWASLETYATISTDKTITLHTSDAFDGAVLLLG